MFWFLHYAVKVFIGVALVGFGVLFYVNRHWFAPADAWVKALGRAQVETLPILGTSTGLVVAVPTGDTVVMVPPGMRQQGFRIAGVMAPGASRNLRSEQAMAFRTSREFLEALVISNQVSVAYTYFVPPGGGLGGVYLGGTNLALPLLSAGMVMVHDGSLKSLPWSEQVQLLAAEKVAREEKRGFWTNTVVLGADGEMKGVPEDPANGTGE